MQSLLKLIKAVAGGEVSAKGSEGGAIYTLDYQVQWTAKGYGRQAMSTTDLVGLVVRPSALSQLSLYNEAAGGGVCLVIERVFAHHKVSTALETEGSIWLCVHPVGVTKPAGNNITVKNSLSGLPAGGGATVIDTAEAVADDGWFPWGNWIKTDETGVTPGGHVEAEVGGRIIIPPLAMISIQTVSGVTGDKYNCGFHWFEVPQNELGLGT